MKWETVELGNVCAINPPRLKDIDPATDVSFVAMQDISEVPKTIVSEVTKSFLEISKGYTPFNQGDVLLAKITPCFENGKVAVADILHSQGYGSSEFHVFRPIDKQTTDNRFIYYFLQLPYFIENAKRNMTGSAGQKRVPKKFLEITTPPPGDIVDSCVWL